MAMKHVSDEKVLKAVLKSRDGDHKYWPYELLSKETGECEKVCYRAMERTNNKGYLDYGVSLRTAWVTPEGKEFLENRAE